MEDRELPTFEHNYGHATLVGNWLESRLFRRGDPPIKTDQLSPEVVQQVMQSTYQVSYGHNQTSHPLGDAAGDAGLAAERSRPTTDVDRVLLFCTDPVVDPTMPPPSPTNTTYGKLLAVGGNDGSRDGSTRRHGDQQTFATEGDGGREMIASDRNLYDSVVRSSQTRRKADVRSRGATSTILSRASKRSSDAPVGSSRVSQVHLATMSGGANSTWRLQEKTQTTTAVKTRSVPWKKADASADEAPRFLSTKAAADQPMEDYYLQRRLPPAKERIISGAT